MPLTDALIRKVIAAIEGAFEGDALTDAWVNTPYEKREAMREKWAAILKDAARPDPEALAMADTLAAGLAAFSDACTLAKEWQSRRDEG